MKQSVFLLFFFAVLVIRTNGQPNPQNFNRVNAQVIRIVVPDVTGKNMEVAIQQITDLNLVQGTITQMQSNQPAGTVIRQAPGAGSRVIRGTPVNLYVSAGLPVVVVPRVTDYTLDEARNILSGSQLRQGRLDRQPSDIEPGRVIAQNPSAGASVARGSAVDLTISVRPQIVTVVVPDVTGRKINDAQKILDGAELQANEIYFEKSDAEDGTIISQKPRAGERVDKGTSVILIAARHNPPPPIIFWGGLVVTIILLGGFIRWRFRKASQKQKSQIKEPGLKLTVIPDKGKQTFHEGEFKNTDHGLHIKILPDKGIQTLKTN